VKTIRQLLRIKGHHVWSIGPNAPVYEALGVMSEKDVGALVVLETGTVIGMISERDYARKVILAGKSSKDTPVWQIMSPHVVFARAEQSVEACLALMNENRIRHLPVLEGENLAGMVSIGDLVGAIIAEQKTVIRALESHIHAHGSLG
jgi:CBS domain-containing protein